MMRGEPNNQLLLEASDRNSEKKVKAYQKMVEESIASKSGKVWEFIVEYAKQKNFTL